MAPSAIGNRMARQATSSVMTQVLQAAGVYVKGFTAFLDIMQQYRVCLAPLRYGAGLKGKIMDSWAHGLPVCTTPVGAEGMFPATSQTPEGFPDTQVRKLGTAVPFSKFVQSCQRSHAHHPGGLPITALYVDYLFNLLMPWLEGSCVEAASQHVWCYDSI